MTMVENMRSRPGGGEGRGGRRDGRNRRRGGYKGRKVRGKADKRGDGDGWKRGGRAG
jgi:hypothetical protein